MPPSSLLARLVILAITLGLLASACATGAANSRIGDIVEPGADTEADGSSDPRDGLDNGKSGGSDPTEGGTAKSTDPGVPGGRAGGADPTQGGTTDINLLLQQIPELGRFSGVLTSDYTVTYSMEPSLIDNLRFTNYSNQQQAVLTEYPGGHKTWAYYDGLTMTVSCDTGLGRWQCRRTDEPLTLSIPSGLEPKALAALRLHSVLFAGLAASGGFKPVAHTNLLGYPTTCYRLGGLNGSSCLNSMGVSLKLDIDLGNSIVFTAKRFDESANPADAIPPAPVVG